MDDGGTAERVASGIREDGRKRIQVRNANCSSDFLPRLSSIMEDSRFIHFAFGREDPVREALREYFTGSGLPDVETAFEAGWRSHVTETALVGGGRGIEAAAGLNSLREPFRRYLLEGRGDAEAVQGILSSFTMTLPTVFLLTGYPGSWPFDSPDLELPPLVAFTEADAGFPFADLILDSGGMSLDAASEFLTDFGCSADPLAVLEASEGKAGLVMLYAGIRAVFGIESSSTREMLRAVLDSREELARFASVAALMSPGFLPSEVSSIASIRSTEPFAAGRRMNLWKGSLLADFLSPEARCEILARLNDEERNRLLTAGAEEVIRSRGNSPVSLEYAGDLLFRAAKDERASELFLAAAELETRELKKAGLYRKAALASGGWTEELSFREALSLFREQQGEKPGTVPEGLERNHFAELSPAVQEAEALFLEGRYHRAYMVLAFFALSHRDNAPVALTEIGEQLLRRNMVESALCVFRAAAASASEAGFGWLEARALSGSMKACNRAGRFREAEKTAGRLFQLALDSGNRARLVGAYNLYANSLLLRTSYGKALKVYTSCLRALEENRQGGLRSVILNNMSVAQRRLFRTEEALGSLMRFARTAVSEGSLARAATAYGNMARLFIDLSRFDSASDCLETMIEFRKISGADPVDDSVLFISSQIAFAEGHPREALRLMEKAVEGARVTGNLRRLSLNLVKMGSMLLRTGKYAEAAEILTRAEEASLKSSSMLNAFVARVKGAAAKCFAGCGDPASLLSIPLTGTPEDNHRGEQYYYHWRLTGSLQSQAAAAQLLSRGLAAGLHHHSYLHMLHEIALELPSSLAVAIPLVHNYPSCDQVKGD